MLENEVAFLKYLLDSPGDKEAYDAVKGVDSLVFQSYATRQAVELFKQSLTKGVWPSKDDVLKHLDIATRPIIDEAFNAAPLVSNPFTLVELISSEANKRRALECLSQSFHLMRDGKRTVDEVISDLQSFSVRHNGWEERDMADVIADVRSNTPLGGELQKSLLVTGIESIDKALAAPPGSYGVVGAMPGVGKTSLLFQIATLSAMSGARVYAMSLETPKATLEAKAAASFYASQGGAAYTNSLLKSGGYNFSHQYGTMPRDQMRVGFHPAGLAFNQLESKIRRMAESGFNVFLIDYFSLLEPPDLQKKSEHSQAAEMSKAIKALAAKLQVHITFVVQPNGDVEYDQRPAPNKLSTSKQVFRDYDFGLFMWQVKEKAEVYQQLNGNHLKLLKCWLHKNRLFNSEDHSIKPEPEVWVEAELRRNFFKEILEPAMAETGMSRANQERSRI